jgi:hypothetical protein
MTALVVAAANASRLSARCLLPSIKWNAQSVLAVRVTAVLLLLLWTASSLAPGAATLERGRVRIAALSPLAPNGVVRYVTEHRPPQPVFNDYLRSGFYHWSFAGNPPLFIDLHNVYPPALLREYFEIVSCTPEGRRRFRERKINTVIFGHWDAGSRVAPLAHFLDNPRGDWERKYSGVDGTVWVRKPR